MAVRIREGIQNGNCVRVTEVLTPEGQWIVRRVEHCGRQSGTGRTPAQRAPELVYKLSNTPPVEEGGNEASRLGGSDPNETEAPDRWQMQERPLWQWAVGLLGLGITVFTIGYFWTKGQKSA